MSPAALVEAVTRHGVELRAVGDRVQCRPVDALPEELRATLRQHRAEVAAYLRDRRRREAAGTDTEDYQRRESVAVGSARPPAPNRRCPGCGCGLQAEDHDLSLCGTCRWTLEYLEPRRVQ